MLFKSVLTVVLVLCTTSSAIVFPREKNVPDKHLKSDRRTAEALKTLKSFVDKNGCPSKTCTLENAAVRRDWDSLSKSEKKDYIKAVKCLQRKPAKTSPEVAPGARSRFDDFVVTHIQQTLTIHGTGNFLSWHRYFTWTYETALREECGYKGYQPYYNWPRWAHNPLKAPLFDGSDTSISGNGKKQPHSPIYVPNPQVADMIIPAEGGGGCVQDGPFKDMVANLGPVSPVLDDATPNPLTSGLGYNPRCLRRDISTYSAKRWSTDEQVVDLLDNYDDVDSFQNRFQGDFPNQFLGAHAAGHYAVGGDPGGDFYVSTGDPYFFLHHSMVDRVWWTWQNADPAKRTYAISGTNTLNNIPPSPNTTLDDTVELGVNSPPIKIRELMSSIAGAFCYIYE